MENAREACLVASERVRNQGVPLGDGVGPGAGDPEPDGAAVGAGDGVGGGDLSGGHELPALGVSTTSI